MEQPKPTPNDARRAIVEMLTQDAQILGKVVAQLPRGPQRDAVDAVRRSLVRLVEEVPANDIETLLARTEPRS